MLTTEQTALVQFFQLLLLMAVVVAEATMVSQDEMEVLVAVE